MAHPRGAHTWVAWTRRHEFMIVTGENYFTLELLDFHADGSLEKVVVILCVRYYVFELFKSCAVTESYNIKKSIFYFVGHDAI